MTSICNSIVDGLSNDIINPIHVLSESDTLTQKEDYEYATEIDDRTPRAQQPKRIKLNLKAHQLACLYKAVQMEQTGKICYNIKETPFCSSYHEQHNKNIKDKVQMQSNVGIIGDIVGYGKTLTALSIIASSDINKIHINRNM